MTESNWAAQENGARIADVSFEDANSLNPAANLLCAREDELWLTGSAPQHVTLSLASSHPPLQYAGWHVWLDSPTNPKVVEIASGHTTQQLRPLLVCEALPGAGTQVWKLPRAIPAEHTLVRFTIRESFGPGPTYMNTLVLLESDPGPDYNANNEAPPTTSVSLTAAGPQYTSPAAATPLMSSRLSSASGNHVRGVAERSPLPRRVTPPSGPPPPPAGINVSATSRRGRSSDDGGRSDVGVFMKTSTLHPNHPVSAGAAGHYHDGTHPTSVADDPLQPAGPAERGRSAQTLSPRMRSNSRMSQLLRDLDDDIKLLKPIKSVSPGKNMLMYLSQENSGLQAESFDERLTPDRRSGSSEGSNGNADRGDSDADRHRRQRRQPREHHSQRHGRRSDDDDEGESGSGRPGGVHHRLHSGGSATSGVNGLHAGARPHPAHMDIALYPPPPPAAAPPTAPSAPAVNAGYEARLNALERAVAALNEAVQHQRDDLTMIKRLLLQQATERRKEAEQRFEERQRYERMSSAGNGIVVVPTQAAPPPPSPAAPAPTVVAAASAAQPGFVPDGRLTHRNITVDFPEDALRVFVESVLEQRMRKHTKKVEAKLLQRLDKQLHDVIKVLSATVEGQLSNVANVAATANANASYAAAAAASLSTPPSMYADPMHTSSTGGRLFSPISQSSLVQGTSRHDVGHDAHNSTNNHNTNGHATPPRGGAASSSISSKEGLSHTPRSQTETGVGGFHPRVWSGKR